MTAQRDFLDWFLFLFLSLLWASAYAMTRGAVFGAHGLPPVLVIPGRLVIGAIILNLVIGVTGRRYPSLSDLKLWAMMAGMGFLGMTGPFFIIAVAQQNVDSSLAALYVAAAPIFVVAGAHFMFEDEKLTSRIALGIGIGFIGVMTLFGPEVFQSFGSTDATAHILLLAGAMLYAASTLLARMAPKMEPLVFASGFVTLAALMSLPMLLLVDWQTVSPNSIQIFSVIGLGAGPSALASLLYMMVVQRAGATFLALTGYLVPVLSAVIGYIAFREVQDWNTLLAFALILSGVWLAQKRTLPKRPAQ